jgi:hypothetical protein
VSRSALKPLAEIGGACDHVDLPSDELRRSSELLFEIDPVVDRIIAI